MRYFQHDNANQPVQVGGKQIQFEAVSHVAGKLLGVHAAEGAEADQLAQLVSRRVGIIEISLDDYEKLRAQKKTTPFSNSLNSLRNSPRPVVQPGSGPQQPLEAKQGVVSAGGNLPPENEKPDLPDVGDVLKVEPVAPPKPIVEGERRVGESKRRSKPRAE